ncbi:MAG: hypothetical protein Q8O62_09925 [Aequorivita sp.]|nr:hypothetical protein [Aequorivita sp.]
MQVAKGFAAFEVGKRVGRGVVGAITPLVKPKDANQAQMIKGGLALVAIVAAAAYTGKNKDLVVPALVGVAAEQAGDVIDAQAAKMITKEANPAVPQKFLQDAMGLGCACGDLPHDQMPPNYNYDSFPMLGSPTIREIEWDRVWDGVEQNEFTGA